MDTKNSCFSEERFDAVYAYIEKQLVKSGNDHYRVGDIELHLAKNAQIFLKQSNFTLAIISREKGVYSLVKVLGDNKRMVTKADDIFCSIHLKQQNAP